jgi:hypothetical protein
LRNNLVSPLLQASRICCWMLCSLKPYHIF